MSSATRRMGRHVSWLRFSNRGFPLVTLGAQICLLEPPDGPVVIVARSFCREIVLAPEDFLLNSIDLRAVKSLSAGNQRVASAKTNWIVLTALGLAVVSGGGGVGSAAEADRGSDKIQFSGAGDAIPLPERAEVNERLSGSMELLHKGNSLGGALDRPGGLPPASTPRPGLSPRLLERLDREKNWVLNQPEDLNPIPTPEEVMQIWDYDLDRALGVRGAMGDSNEKRSATRQINPGQSDSAVVLDDRFGRGFQPPGGAHIGGWLGQGFGSQPSSITPLPLIQNQPTPETRAKSSVLRISDLSPALSREQVTPDLQGLLVSPNTLNPLATDFDPINLGPDSTRREINPVTSPSLSDLRAGRRFDTAFSLPAAGTGGNSHSTVLEEMTARILGPSSLSPALAVPIEPSKPKAKPNTREPLGRKL